MFNLYSKVFSSRLSVYGQALVKATPKFSPEAIYNAQFAHPEN